MKFLIDHNLPPRLAVVLADAFPGSKHVLHLRLDRSRDLVLWRFCIEHEYALMTQDDDFTQISNLKGAPPKLVYLANAQGDANDLAEFVQHNLLRIKHFIEHSEESMLQLRKP